MDNPFGGFEPHPRLLDVVSPTNGVSLCNLSSASDAGVCRVLSWLGRVRGLFRFVVVSLWWCGFRLVGRECPCVAAWRWSCAAAFRPGRPACRGWCCRRGRGRMRDASSCLRRGRARRRCLRVACWSPRLSVRSARRVPVEDGHEARRRHPHYKEASSASRCRFPSDGSCPYQRSGASRVRRQHSRIMNDRAIWPYRTRRPGPAARDSQCGKVPAG